MKFKHKITGQILTIKKEYGNIVSCYTETTYYLKNTLILVDTCIVNKENLIQL